MTAERSLPTAQHQQMRQCHRNFMLPNARYTHRCISVDGIGGGEYAATQQCDPHDRKPRVFEEQSARDWETFLLCRAKELVPGNVYIHIRYSVHHVISVCNNCKITFYVMRL